MNRLAVSIGQTVGQERRRRRWTLRTLADRSGISIGRLSEIEAGMPASLETYARIFAALDLPLELAGSPRDRAATVTRGGQDLVHSAMGELEAGRLHTLGYGVAIDEPYQHYQFAGRADVIAFDRGRRALLHIENRTQFPNVQEALGSFGAKRAYLGGVLADRLGVRGGWKSETHLIAGLWSSEVIHVARLRSATFGAACPDGLDAFRAWWAGDPASVDGVTSSFALIDPGPGVREAYRFTQLSDATRPRYRNYGEAAGALRRA